MATPEGFEPSTFRLEGGRSHPLNYGVAKSLQPLMSYVIGNETYWIVGERREVGARADDVSSLAPPTFNSSL
jgi:hypothetical protein